MERIRFSLTKKLLKGCVPEPKVWQLLLDWHDSALGSRLAIEEKSLLDEILPNLFGYHLCQMGVVGDSPLYDASRIAHCFVMDISLLPEQVAQVQASPLMLPIATDSVDVVILPHVLEFCEQPHEVLREVERVLIAEGHLVLTAINPVSLWMVWKLLFGWRRKLPWCGRFYTAQRVKDWLALLGFDIKIVHYYFYRPPFSRNGLLKRTRFLEPIGRKLFRFFGGGYVIVAKKRVETLTPIRPRWYSRRVMPGLVEPFSSQKRKRKIADNHE